MLIVKVVLVVNPDEAERGRIARAIREAGYNVLEARDETEALAQIRGAPQALLVVAEETPPGPPLEVIVTLRQATRAPLLFVARQGVSELEALALGADHYQRRPLLPELLVTRVRSLSRRWREGDDPDGNHHRERG